MNIRLSIPESFYDGEERSGYYVSPDMKKIWAVELDLIAEFSRVCEKNNLKWWINYGTLLGAVRHNGFVPWDDEVDIVMMRSDFEKLCALADDEFKQPYHLRNPHNDPERPMEYAKLHNEDTTLIDDYNSIAMIKHGRKFTYSQGIWIDIFPMYGVPDDDRTCRQIFRKLKLYRKLSSLCRKLIDNYYPAPTKWKRPFKAALHFMAKAMNLGYDYRKYFAKFMETLDLMDDPNSIRTADFWPMITRPDFLANFLLPRSFFGETVYMTFEMLTLPAPSCYEEMLTRYYGDWKKCVIRPPHGMFSDTERSYKYYIEYGLPDEVRIP